MNENMGRPVVLTLKYEWWLKMLSGEKGMEMRKSFPAENEGKPFIVYVCLSASGGMIAGQFTCRGHIKGTLSEFVGDDKPYRHCVSGSDLGIYSHMGQDTLHGWLMKDLRKFKGGYTVKDFGFDRAPQSWCFATKAPEITIDEVEMQW